MRVLFVHQNFPGQFRHVAKALAESGGHRVVAIGDARNLRGRPVLQRGIDILAYPPLPGGNPNTHHYLRDHEQAVRRGQAVARVAIELKRKGFSPDVIVAHPAWGEALYLKDVFPEARHVYYCEYFYDGYSGDVGFDPEFPAELDDRLKARTKNATQLLSLVAADDGLAPTQWQKSRYPAEFQAKIRVVHEGIDTQVARPDPRAFVEVNGRRFTAGDPVVTYVARNLEPYRGFHTFMRALPALLAARPDAHVLIVGGDDVSYGRRLPEGETYRARYCQELQGKVDWSRVHFLGRLPYADYLRVLQISAAHVYLTYPFVLSWSMLEAMSTGCALVASDTAPVREVVVDGENGRLTDFFDAAALSERIQELLENPGDYATMRAHARQTVIDRYDLSSRCLPELLAWLDLAK